MGSISLIEIKETAKGFIMLWATPPTDLRFKLDAQILSHDTKAKLW